MSRVQLIAIALSAVCLGLETEAMAKVDPFNSEAPDLILLVARGSGGPDRLGSFTVIVRDFNRVPSEGERSFSTSTIARISGSATTRATRASSWIARAARSAESPISTVK